MNWKGFVTGFSIGTTIGLIAKRYRSKVQSSEQILQIIKNKMKPYGNIIGSWIFAKPEKIQNGQEPTFVYKGGITQIRDGKQTRINFIADAYTGEILHME